MISDDCTEERSVVFPERYETIEHDMRYCKEYLTNLKFNYIELTHKEIFLRAIIGGHRGGEAREDGQGEEVKEKLKEKKREIRRMEEDMERLSREIYEEERLLGARKKALSETKALQSDLVRRIHDIEKREEALRRYNEIKKEEEAKVARINSLVVEIDDKKKSAHAREKAVADKRRALECLREKKAFFRRRIELFEQRRSAPVFYLYNWYRTFTAVFSKCLGAKIGDVKKAKHRPETSILQMAQEKEPEEALADEITVTVIAVLEGNASIPIAISFVDGRLHGVTINGASPNGNSADLLSYCKRVNSAKFLLFESLCALQ